MGRKILTLNLGTTSTRVAVYNEKEEIAKKTLYHSESELASFIQKEHVEKRAEMMRTWLDEISIRISDLHAVCMRVASLPKQVTGGVYKVEGLLREDIMARYEPDKPLIHGSDIIIPFTDALAGDCDIPYLCAEPANQNNMIPEARLSGHPLIERDTIFHALNQKSVARDLAEKLGKHYIACNFVIAHMGGGISVSAHQKGRVTDTNNCGGEEGAFSATRSGTLPARKLIDLCFSGRFTHEEMLDSTHPRGGVLAYLGTSDMREVEKRMQGGDKWAGLIFRTMAYRTAKEIGALCAVIEGDLDAIILTGGMAQSKVMSHLIEEKVKRFAPFYIYPGERESEALASGVLRILNREEALAVYPEEVKEDLLWCCRA